MSERGDELNLMEIESTYLQDCFKSQISMLALPDNSGH